MLAGIKNLAAAKVAYLSPCEIKNLDPHSDGFLQFEVNDRGWIEGIGVVLIQLNERQFLRPIFGWASSIPRLPP